MIPPGEGCRRCYCSWRAHPDSRRVQGVCACPCPPSDHQPSDKVPSGASHEIAQGAIPVGIWVWITPQGALFGQVPQLLWNPCSTSPSPHPPGHRGRAQVPGEGSEEQRSCIILLIQASICSAKASSWEAARGSKWVCWISQQHFPLQVQGQSHYPWSHG